MVIYGGARHYYSFLGGGEKGTIRGNVLNRNYVNLKI